MPEHNLKNKTNSQYKRRIILIGHRDHLERYQKGFYDALERHFNLHTLFVEDGWPFKISDITRYQDYDACIWYVRFRELILMPGFNWEAFSGLRIMYDLDIHANYHPMLGQKWLGKWPEVFRRNNFQVLVTTGRNNRDALISDGINAYWLPKAYDPSRLFDLGLERHGICYFGNCYVSRSAMLDYLNRKKIEYTTFRCRHNELNAQLNKYSGCLICNMAGIRRRGIYRLIHHYYPSLGIRLAPGFEPMLKNFEVAGASCAPIADWIDEFDELGFEDGKTMVSYKTFEELVEKLQHYLRNPDELEAIGKRAGKLALERHTWDQRAEQLDELLASYT